MMNEKLIACPVHVVPGVSGLGQDQNESKIESVGFENVLFKKKEHEEGSFLLIYSAAHKKVSSSLEAS